MKFTLDRHSLETFNKGRLLEIEGLYSPERVGELNRLIDDLLHKEKLEKREESMRFAHDLFRQSEALKKGLNLSALAQIAYELIAVKPLRLVYDQLLECAKNNFDKESPTAFFEGEKSLQERSSVSDLVLGARMALKGDQPGNVVFFGPEIPLPLEFLKERLNDRYLLLAFSSLHAQYVFQAADPQNHFLKRLGYVYGDKLKDSLHPLIYG